ncbi:MULTISPECIES: hypothetical protein [unclassified Yoonia]|uniref:hypothetical protein n=1 Tax=unclassified Yoonia TaxID=2629118 RepID=UPI002AFFD82B|nr:MULTISPECIES: hypothetical protein [unclassified Yoonia]
MRQVDKKISSIMAAIEDGMYQPSMKDRIAELEGEKRKLTAYLAQSPKPTALRLHPSLSEVYRMKIRNLSAALQDPGLKTEVTEALRGLSPRSGRSRRQTRRTGTTLNWQGNWRVFWH